VFEFYVACCEALWGLALVLGIILCLSLFLGVIGQARYNNARKRAQEQGEGDAWSL
jgi:DNA-binding transcriptional regulator of glucitol operon